MNPKEQLTEFAFPLDNEYNYFGWFAVDYNMMVKITNAVFDWDYTDEIIKEISRSGLSEKAQVEEYMEFFTDQIKNIKTQLGGFTVGEVRDIRRSEILEALLKHAKRTG